MSLNLSKVKSTIIKQTGDLYASPASVQQVALDLLEIATEGDIDIPDPSSPFMFLLEASATQAATACLKAESVAMERYPRLAQTYEHLYHHMADADYLDRFATPSRTGITLVIPTQTLKEFAVLDMDAGVRRVRIPKETVINVGGLDWYLHYPIVIEIGGNDIIHVYYDLSANTPLMDNLSNLLSYQLVNNLDREELVIDIPVEQLSLESLTTPVSVSVGFSGVYTFSDQFYYLRAYHRWGAGEWQEMRVTHSDMVFDIDHPTLVVKVEGGAIHTYIPDIYMTSNAIGSHLRLDIYTTKGPVNMDLMDYASEDFNVQWRDLNVNGSPEVQALANINNMRIFAADPITSGRDGLSFEELKDRVIYRSADQRASITFNELSYQLKDRGYTLGRAKDTVMERLYICARSIPMPEGSSISTPIGVRHAYIGLDSQNTEYRDILRPNYGRVTLMPNAIFKGEHGTAYPVSDRERYALDAMDDESRAALLNEGNHYFTPFFYVLDADVGLFSARTYYLDAGRRVSQSFIDANDSIPYRVTTRDMTVRREEDRFIVEVLAEHPAGLERLYGQLTYIDSSDRRYSQRIEQEPVDSKTSRFTFTLISNMDVTPDDLLGFVNLIGQSGSPELIYTELSDVFHIFYFRESASTSPTLFDHYLIRDGLGSVVAITHESCRIRWGYSLPTLFSRTRATLLPPVYERYTESVPATYPENVYRRDAEGKLVWVRDPESGRPIFDIIHRAGETVYLNGEVQYEHAVGDVVMRNGEAVVAEAERMVWEISPLLLDGRYRYATAPDAAAYRDSIGDVVQGFLTHDIATITPTLMERTELRYQATASVGETLVTVDGKKDVLMETGLAFEVNYMLTPAAYRDTSLRKQLIRFTRDTLARVVDSRTFSMGRTIEALMRGNADVINVAINNPIHGYNVARITGDNMHFSIQPRLVLQSNGDTNVEDSIDVTFTLEREIDY